MRSSVKRECRVSRREKKNNFYNEIINDMADD